MALKFAKLASLIIVAIVATYFGPKALSSLFYIGVVIAYLYSKDEVIWFTFFFVISDGFLGFFNNYEAVVSIIPGLPEVEVGHLYVVGTIFKVRNAEGKAQGTFFDRLLLAMAAYVIFLILQGYAIGVTPEIRAHFRILKFVLPLVLFYTIPRIFTSRQMYRETFELFIPFAFLALFAQVFTVATGLAPSQFAGVRQDLWFTDVYERGQTYRGFYSTGMVLISFFGALYYSTVDPTSRKRVLYLAVIVANFLSAFLSATRGWVLGFTVILLLHSVFVAGLKVHRIALVAVVGTVLMFGLLQVPAVQKQFSGAADRILTIGLLAKGDVTAGGTLERLDRRAPRVINKWKASPLTGWGFSDDFKAYGDSHVGNHNVLLHSGIIGAVLMVLFLGFFSWTLMMRSMTSNIGDPNGRGLLLFPIFLLGWFMIHSSSGQQFMFYGELGVTLPQALFFSFGSFCYWDHLKNG